MEEFRLDNELGRLHQKLPFLWKNYGFHVKYFTRDYGMYYRGFIIGLENDVCKLIFEKETNSQVEPIRDYIGTKSAPFNPPDYSYYAEYGWYSLSGMIYWLSGVQYESDRDVDKDLETLSEYLALHIDKLLDLFRNTSEFEKRFEQLRNLNKSNQITVKEIKEERARLHSLGQNSSLEAAIASLRRGKK